jgi:hypothetical protein
MSVGGRIGPRASSLSARAWLRFPTTGHAETLLEILESRLRGTSALAGAYPCGA